MLEYEEKVRQFIKKHQLIDKGDKIVVGVSGGPDSLSLLHYLARKREFYGIDLFAVHLDHMFRGQESYEELLFVEEFCKEFIFRAYPSGSTLVRSFETMEQGFKKPLEWCVIKFFNRQ